MYTDATVLLLKSGTVTVLDLKHGLVYVFDTVCCYTMYTIQHSLLLLSSWQIVRCDLKTVITTVCLISSAVCATAQLFSGLSVNARTVRALEPSLLHHMHPHVRKQHCTSV
jgi:hypothetical protein